MVMDTADDCGDGLCSRLWWWALQMIVVMGSVADYYYGLCRQCIVVNIVSDV